MPDSELDQFLERTNASMLETLDEHVDVKQKLRDLYKRAGIDPAPGDL
jgi:hypothetical protein